VSLLRRCGDMELRSLQIQVQLFDALVAPVLVALVAPVLLLL